MKNGLLYPIAALIVVSSCVPALADSTTDAILRRLEAKIDALAKDNAELRAQLNQNRAEKTRVTSVAPTRRTATNASPPSQLPKNVYAAAYPAKAAYAKAAPEWSWTGCYIGVHAGGGWQSSSYTSLLVASGAGALGGAQAGCNRQWEQFVIGIEGEFWGSTLYDRSYNSSTNNSFDRFSHNRWDASLSVRSGVAFERAFVYGKVGAALGKFDYTTDQVSGSNTYTERGNASFVGALLGVGFEYALTDNWTTKFEYNYIDFGNKIVDLTHTDCTPACVTYLTSGTIKEIKQFAKIGVNYKF
jgi:outer membrane immunogenic protein